MQLEIPPSRPPAAPSWKKREFFAKRYCFSPTPFGGGIYHLVFLFASRERREMRSMGRDSPAPHEEEDLRTLLQQPEEDPLDVGLSGSINCAGGEGGLLLRSEYPPSESSPLVVCHIGACRTIAIAWKQNVRERSTPLRTCSKYL